MVTTDRKSRARTAPHSARNPAAAEPPATIQTNSSQLPLRQLAVALTAVFAFLPMSTWLSADVDAPTLNDIALRWMLGTALTATIAFIVAAGSNRPMVQAWLERARSLIERRWWQLCTILVVVSLALNAFAAWSLF